MEIERYKRALTRNLYEIRDLLSKRNALNALVEVQPDFGHSFFRYAYTSLFNDMMAHAMKVLDSHRDATSFWYLVRCEEKQILSALSAEQISIEDVKSLSEKLKDVRDKTHFHIDRIDVFAPDEVWKRADIKGKEFNVVYDCLWGALNVVYQLIHGQGLGEVIYQGGDVGDIISASRKAGVKI